VGRGLWGRDNGGDVTNVQYKPYWNGHCEFPLYNEYILIKFFYNKKEVKSKKEHREMETKPIIQRDDKKTGFSLTRHYSETEK
jgi:hypothetical protein